MSKDIRSFFTVGVKKKPQEDKKPAVVPEEKPSSGSPKSPKQKRKASVISSDEGSPSTSKDVVKKQRTATEHEIKKPKLSKLKKIPDEDVDLSKLLDEDDDMDESLLNIDIDESTQNTSESSKTPVSKKTKKAATPKSQKSDLNESVLTDEERFERKRMAAMMYQKFKNRTTGALNPGCKEIPKGKTNCLAGCTFLISGVLQSIDRDEGNQIIKDLGGKVSTVVGKKLNYLVVGEDAGLKKLATAEELGVKQLTEDEFFDLIRIKSGEKPLSKKKKDESPAKIKNGKKNPEIKKEVEEQPSKSSESPPKKIKKEKETLKQIEVKAETNASEEESLPWVEKYKPKDLKQIIGQQGPASNCNKLLNWLRNWYGNNNGKKKMQRPNPWAKNDDGSFYKCALLSGPPGVGKTTTATLVCKELEFDTVEFNASDTRSKKLLKEQVSELLSNKSLFGYFHGQEVVSKKHVLLMDEVDGMAGNEDRGGVQELISLIKETSIPIICMCNDRNHPKMRSLVNYCFDLRFNKPQVNQIKGAIMSICFKEKFKLPPVKVEEIILATNNDIRQTLNHLSLLSAGMSVDLGVDTNKLKTAEKDLKLGPWEVVRKVFSAEEHEKMSLHDKCDLFFHDYSMGPLFVQQNYLSVSPNAPKHEVPARVALTADALSIGDLIERSIRSNMAWSLLPTQAVFSSLMPGEYMCGKFTGQINFPGWLGKNSKSNKRSRLAQEIHDHTRIRTSGSRTSIRLDYAPYLLSAISNPLKKHGNDGIHEALNVIKEYRLLREDIDSLIELTAWPGKKSSWDSIDGHVKAGLTRAYNKEVMAYTYSASSGVKKKASAVVSSAEEEYGMVESEEGLEVLSDNEDDESVEKDALIKAKKKTVTGSSSKSKASGDKKKPPAKNKGTSKAKK